MNFNTFRRGGLFDPITFDSGRALAQGTGEFFGGFGKPIMSASKPADLRLMADKALSSGNTQEAQRLSAMAEQIEMKQQEAVAKREARRKALTQTNQENDVLLAEAVGDQKRAAMAKKEEAQAKEKIENLAKIAESRIGADGAAIVRQMDDPKEAAEFVVAQLKQPNRKTKIEKILNPDTGDTEAIVVDEETGERIAKVGVTKKAETPEKDGKRLKALDTQLQVSSHVKNAIKEARDLSEDWFASGFGSGMARKVGGTKAKDMQAALETIKANIGFDRLQRMREESPTGGALGQVAVQELVALQSTLKSLDQSQSDEALRANLDAVEKHYDVLIRAMEQEVADLSGTDGDGWAVVEK